MRTNTKPYLLQPLVEMVRNRGIRACERRAQEIHRSLKLRSFIDTINVGGGKHCAERWPLAYNCDLLIDSCLEFNTKPLPRLRFVGSELKRSYFDLGVSYLRKAEDESRTLFDLATV